MSVNIASKTAKFMHFTLHQLIFKSIDASDFVELYDAVNDYLYQNQACVISSILTGNSSSAKTINKAAKKVFDEVNWPLSWIGASKESNHSGCFLAISGVNVFTIVGADFITKIVETPEARFAYVGGVFADSVENIQQIDELVKRRDYALEMAGLIAGNTVRSWYNVKSNTNFYADINQIEKESINTIVEGNNLFKDRMLASFFAIQAKNDTIQIEKKTNHSNKLGSVLISYPNAKMIMISSLGDLLNRIEKSDKHEIELTMDAIEALILSHNFSWKNLWRAVGYFNSPEEMAIFKNSCKAKGIPMASVIIVLSEFNEQNIQFVIEADFVITHAE